MPSTTIKVKVKGLILDDKDLPVLELVPQLEAGAALVMSGTAEDVKAFTKLFGRIVPARLSIGEAEEQSPAFNAGHVAGLEQQLKEAHERNAELEARLAAGAPSCTPADLQAAVQKIRDLDHLARGYFTMLAEDAKRQADTAKGGSSGHFLALAREAKAGLAKLEVLCPPVKSTTNGAPAVPAAEA